MSYNPEQTPTIYVDHDALNGMLNAIRQHGTKAVLVGFGEYAKHLINLSPDNVACVYDCRPLFHNKNVTFRGKKIVDLPEKVDANLVICCEFDYLYEYFGRVVRHFDWIPYYFPSRIDYKNTAEIVVFQQEEIYRTVLKNEDDAPISMMGKEKIRFLLDLLRYSLSVSETANILEMGSWQGGSAWFIAKMLRSLGERRKFFMMDLFETHSMDPTATMCYDEIRLRMDAEYDHIEMITGLVDDPKCLIRVEAPICFAHIDLGFQLEGLQFAWDALVPGAPLLLDNYGHLGAPTWKFDDFFEGQGTRVIRFPWSEQGLVIKGYNKPL